MLSERGHFWWSGTKIQDGDFAPAEHVPGLLTISDTGRIKIELDGVLPDPKGRWAVMDQGEISPDKAIAGMLQANNQQILAMVINRNGGRVQSAGFSSEVFTAFYCLVGHQRLPTKPRVRSLDLDLGGYEEWMWLGRPKIKLTRRSLTVKHKIEPDLVFKQLGGTVRLERDLQVNEDGGRWGSTSLKQTARLKFRLPAALEVPAAATQCGVLQDLLILLTNSEYQMAPPNVKLTSGKGATLYFAKQDLSAPTPTFRDFAVGFPKIEAQFGDLLFAWLKAREELGAGAYLYLATRRGLDIYAEHRFLNLMTGLEAYHQARVGNGDMSEYQAKLKRVLDAIPEGPDRSWVNKRLKNAGGPSLDGRLIALLKDVPIPLDKKQFTKLLLSCAKARNELAHRGRSTEADATKDPAGWLWLRGDIVSRLYHARLLLDVGVSPDLVGQWLSGNSMLRAYLRFAGFKPNE